MSSFSEYALQGSRAHLIGIGGVSMSPLAEVLLGQGIKVSGSDMSESEAVVHLRSLGIPVAIGHSPDNIEGADYIVRTAAVRDDNPEIAAAHERGIPVFERAEAWGAIMQAYKNAVCISGTHGKTTTTSMTTHILMAADADPTVMIGGTLPLLGSGYRVGEGDTIVLESCEYYNSFHCFFPTVAVILNVDADHLDFFGNLDNIKASFRKFASLVPENGFIIANADDENTMDALAPLGRDIVTFGFSDSAFIRCTDLDMHGKGSDFTVTAGGERYAEVSLNIPGRHNVANALAAAAVAHVLGLPGSAVRDGLLRFTGAGRRLEFKGKVNGADVFDDYAHHPGELHALIDAVTQLGYKRVICAFQPHTYSRTKAHLEAFASELSRVDKAFIADIYAAREINTFGISSADLAALIPGAVYCGSLENIEKSLLAEARPGDIILTVGAGNIYKAGEAIVG